MKNQPNREREREITDNADDVTSKSHLNRAEAQVRRRNRERSTKRKKITMN